MNHAPPSTPFPVPGFTGGNNNATPAEFLKFLRSLVEQYLGEHCRRVSATEKATWVTIVNGLTDHILGSFPLPDVVSWSAMQEKVETTQATLEVVRRVFMRVDGIYSDSGDLVQKVFVRVLDMCRVLDIWAEMAHEQSEGNSTPGRMRQTAFHLLTTLLRGLDSKVSSEQHEPDWKTLRRILQECIDVCTDVMAPATPLPNHIVIALFRKPRVLDPNDQTSWDPEAEAYTLNFDIAPIARIPAFMTLILEVLVNTVYPALNCQWFLADIARMVGQLAQSLLNYFINSTCPTSAAMRTRCLANIIAVTAPLRPIPEHTMSLGSLPERLLQIRLECCLKLDWDPVDRCLMGVFSNEKALSASQALIHTVIGRLGTGDWNLSDKTLLWCYLRHTLPCLDAACLMDVKRSIQVIESNPNRDAFLVDMSKLPSEVVASTARAKSSKGRLIMPPHAWRGRVQSLIQDIILPDSLFWMDDDEVSSVSELSQRALYELQVRFEQRPLHSNNTASRLLIIQKVNELPCLLSQCDKSDCFSQATNNKFQKLQPYIPLFTRILEGSDAEATADVRRKAYQALGRVLKHHVGTESMDQIMALLCKGMDDGDRSVRISAGSALTNLVQLQALDGEDGYGRAEPIFVQLYQLFETSKNPVRETLLISVGSMGKLTNHDIIGQVLCLLIAQLGRQNPVIKGSACMQILSIARFHQKAPYSLIHPYFDQVAPFITRRLPVQPDLIGEACRIMGIATADFMMITLPRTLPELFASCDQKVLDSIAKEVKLSPSTLLVRNTPKILAHVFLLPNQGATTKALNFIVRVLTDASGSTIDIQSVVKSCIVPLLGELVVVLGDDNQEIASQGVDALKKVERVLPAPKKNLSTSNLEDLLKNYMLGLISQINDMLQDFQGKKSVAMKRKILRSLGALVQLIGEPINNVAPQIMATFQTMVGIPELAEVTLESWYKFLTTLGEKELGAHIGPTSAAIVASWAQLSQQARDTAFHALQYIICTKGERSALRSQLGDIVDLSVVEELRPLSDYLQSLRGSRSPQGELQRILEQSSSDNLTVALQALRELKSFLVNDQKKYIQQITSGDMFDTMAGQILASLLSAACRDNGDNSEALRLLAFECIGALGAMDPDRVEITHKNTSLIVLRNFTDDAEAIVFSLHLIQDLLVGAFRSTSDIKYQSHLAYSIQELLKICQFTPAVVGGSNSLPVKVRHRWNALPKHVLETVTPLLEARYTLNQGSTTEIQHPIYPTQSTYREWIQLWTTHLISRASGPTAQKLFKVFRSAVRSKDVVVAHHLLPHLVLHILISGNQDDAHAVRVEIITVLEDQVDNDSGSTSDKKLLSAQAVFMLLDHLNKWIRAVRTELTRRSESGKRSRNVVDLDEQLLRLDSILSSIDQTLMAKAAFQCKAFARSLMNFEQQIVTIQQRNAGGRDLPEYYEKLHEIYAHLDEPDGMEGISTLILSPTLEHRIREHESTGRWTSAQSCWEVRLQESPDNMEFHLGLLRCLRNLGHYDTLRTHVAGVLTRHPEWESILAGFQAESAWMVGAWDDVERLVSRVDTQTPAMMTARVLLAMRTGDAGVITETLAQSRSVLGAPIVAAGIKGYRRSYEAALDLHLSHELEIIYQTTCTLPPGSQEAGRKERRRAITELSETLSKRLDATLPTFRCREPLLSMRRTAFALSKNPRLGLSREIGKSWLASAKIARKANQWQTAYSAMLQAQQKKAPYSFIESAKLLKASSEPLRALNELENSIKLLRLFDDQVLDLTEDAESERMKAKIQVLRARWMNDCDRFDSSIIFDVFQEAANLQKRWESAHYHLGSFHDECYKALPATDQVTRGLKMLQYVVKSYSKAILYGSKYVYQTVPRMLTIWLDLGADIRACQDSNFKKMTETMAKAIKETPVFKWFTAFPQIVSRVGHENPEVYKILANLIMTVIQKYPRQALWLFTAVVKSTKAQRERRGRIILDQLQNNPQNSTNGVAMLVRQSTAMTNQLLALCDSPVDDAKAFLNMSKDFPRLKALGHSQLIIPLQESLIASLPPTPAAEATHRPFPMDAPTFLDFYDEIEIMKSLAKPRKITIKGSNGQTYMFLGKPKDDLRKDARLMDLNAIINKLLKGNSESRRRQLHIRTYGVVTLNEECGFIQWVPNTMPIRPILMKLYDARRIKSWSGDMHIVFDKIKGNKLPDQECAEMFQSKVLSVFKPVFHEWFIETFPEPTAWLASRLTYGRTAAVMSIVGFILGLGDRHCENILMDMNSGDVVHVDFNCLFEKGKTLDTPERVPFRLTQNIVDALGISGVEGPFRISCEVTMQLLRDNKDLLMSVLDAFVHDPLVEWEDEKRKLESKKHMHNPAIPVVPRAKTDLKVLAKMSLNPIEKKLKGIYSTSSKDRNERELSTSNLVQMLISEATDLSNLSRMYPGWAPWH